MIGGDAIARAVWEAIEDPAVKALPIGVGKVDQFADSTEVLDEVERCRALRSLYGAP